jgi:hypothetical protein
MYQTGLVDVSEDALVVLLRAVHTREVSYPLQLPDLTRIGLQYCAAALMHVLRGLDEPAVRAVLVVAISERRARRGR